MLPDFVNTFLMLQKFDAVAFLQAGAGELKIKRFILTRFC